MGQYVGLDVSMKETAVCVLDEAATVLLAVWKSGEAFTWAAPDEAPVAQAA